MAETVGADRFTLTISGKISNNQNQKFVNKL
jgi:hypothetical protein